MSITSSQTPNVLTCRLKATVRAWSNYRLPVFPALSVPSIAFPESRHLTSHLRQKCRHGRANQKSFTWQNYAMQMNDTSDLESLANPGSPCFLISQRAQ